MKDLSYIRTDMLPQQAPPLGERGAVKWARENLFSGWINSIVTVLAGTMVLAIVGEAVSWGIINGHWSPNSLGECRAADALLEPRRGFQFADLLQFPLVFVYELLAGLFSLDPMRMLMAPKTAVEATWAAVNTAPLASGACWALIRERWHQWLFGFYPQDQYWRPTLAFVMLFVAIAPVLFNKLPKQMIWFTLLYPALCFWLLWGGSVWGPVVAMFGFVVLAAVYRMTQPLIGVSAAAGAGIVAAVLWWLFLDVPAVTALSGIADISLSAVRSSDFGGFLLAITIGVTAISFSLPLGILLALARQSDLLIVKSLAVGFIEFIRGVPLITLLFTASLLLQYFLPPNTEFDIILRVIILVTLFAAAYLAEVIRGGLAALPRGQYEAADALGLDYWRAQRLIILPQALKISIPSIVSTFIGLFKDTTLVSFVGLLDPLRGVTSVVRADINWKGIYWEPYIFVGAIFFVICFGMSRYSMYLEQKLKTDHR